TDAPCRGDQMLLGLVLQRDIVDSEQRRARPGLPGLSRRHASSCLTRIMARMLSPCLAVVVSSDQGSRVAVLCAPEQSKRENLMLLRLTVLVATVAWLASPGAARAEASMVRVAKQFGVAYMQYMVMQELKLIEKHAKASGLDITTEWATFRSSDVMNDALISGSVDFVSLGIPGIITIWSKTKGTPVEVKGVSGLNVSPLM